MKYYSGLSYSKGKACPESFIHFTIYLTEKILRIEPSISILMAPLFFKDMIIFLILRASATPIFSPRKLFVAKQKPSRYENV